MLFVQAETSGVGQPIGGPGFGAVPAGLWRAGRDARAGYILGLKQLVQSNDRAGLQVVGVLLFA